MMPRDYNQVVMYYNRDVFDAVDMPYPTDGMTRTEFVQMLEELQTRISTSTAKNGYGQYYRDMDFLRFQCVLGFDDLAAFEVFRS